MALFKKSPKTSQQKAQKAQLGIFARLIGCGYLIYIVFQLMKTAPEDDILSPGLKIAISIFFLLAAAGVITITVIEFVRNWKNGFYKSASYTDDIINTYAAQEDPEAPQSGEETEGLQNDDSEVTSPESDEIQDGEIPGTDDEIPDKDGE